MKKMVFDIGGTEIKYCVMDADLKRTESGSVPTPQDTQAHMFEALRALYEPHADETEGIAISMPGFIDSKAGRCNGGGALTYNRKTSIAPELSSLCGCPVHIANDGKCAAYAELKSGALTGCTNAAVFIIGTGVGGGLIIGGNVLDGIHHTAGEFSFLKTDCGNWDSDDTMLGYRCSTTGLLKKYREIRGLPEDTPLNGKQFFKAFHAGEEAAVRALDAFALETAKTLTNLTSLLDLEKIAIGGGISRDDALVEHIRAAGELLYGNNTRFSEFGIPTPNIVRCRYGSEANLVGAYLLSLES